MARRKDIELSGVCDECKKDRDDDGKKLVLTRWKERHLCPKCLYDPEDEVLRLEDFMRQDSALGWPDWEKLR